MYKCMCMCVHSLGMHLNAWWHGGMVAWWHGFSTSQFAMDKYCSLTGVPHCFVSWTISRGVASVVFCCFTGACISIESPSQVHCPPTTRWPLCPVLLQTFS